MYMLARSVESRDHARHIDRDILWEAAPRSAASGFQTINEPYAKGLL